MSASNGPPTKMDAFAYACTGALIALLYFGVVFFWNVDINFKLVPKPVVQEHCTLPE